jgi:hypothetical protein
MSLALGFAAQRFSLLACTSAGGLNAVRAAKPGGQQIKETNDEDRS